MALLQQVATKTRIQAGLGTRAGSLTAPPGQMRTNDSSLSRLEGLTLTLRRVSFRVMATILRGAELALFSNPPPGGLLLRVDLLFQAEGFFQTFLFRLFWSSSSS